MAVRFEVRVRSPLAVGKTRVAMDGSVPWTPLIIHPTGEAIGFDTINECQAFINSNPHMAMYRLGGNVKIVEVRDVE